MSTVTLMWLRPSYALDLLIIVRSTLVVKIIAVEISSDTNNLAWDSLIMPKSFQGDL